MKTQSTEMLAKHKEVIEAERALEARNLRPDPAGKGLFTSDLLANKGNKFSHIKQADEVALISDHDSDCEEQFGREFDD